MSQLHPFTDLLSGIGAPVQQLLERAKLPGSAHDNPLHFISAPRGWDFANLAAQSQGIPDLGWRAIEAAELTSLGSWTRHVARAATLRDAIRALDYWYQKEVPIVRTGLGDGGDCAWLGRLRLVNLHRYAGDELVEQFTLGRLIKVVRLVAGENWVPTRVKLEFRRHESRLPPNSLPGARVEYGQPVIAIAVSWEMLEWRLPGPKPLQSTLPEPEAPCTDFAGSLRQALSPLVSERSLSLALAAEIAGTSERSQRRRLAEEGTSWRQIFDAIRLDACLPRVRDTAIPLHEIAQTLGYSDHAHFTRAFHRWTGQTPSAFRRRARHEPPLGAL